MRFFLSVFFITTAFLACKQSDNNKTPASANPLSSQDPKVVLPPDERYGILFDSVQMSGIFPDSKTFLDCVPKMTTDEILAHFESERKKPNFDLSVFINQYFKIPQPLSLATDNAPAQPIQQYISNQWGHLTRKVDTADLGTLIQLPNPYVVQYDQAREVYYQDAYFTMLGLKAANKIDLLENMVNNFAYLIDIQGYIPAGNRTYYLSRTQPPYFACMVQLLASVKGDKIYKKYLPQLEKEYSFWMEGKPSEVGKETVSKKRVVCLDKNVLNRYYGEEKPRLEFYKEDKILARKSGQDLKPFYRHIRAADESGWGLSSRWLSDGKNVYKLCTSDIIPVDLNALMYNLELTIMKGKILDKKMDEATNYEKIASTRREAIMRYCWSDEKKMFFDFDFQKYKKREVYSLAAIYPLFFKMVTKKEADKVAENIEQNLLRAGGVVATNNITKLSLDAPLSTAALQWITIQGLKNYGHATLAEDIKNRWVSLNTSLYQSTGKVLDKYNVEDLNLIPDSSAFKGVGGYGSTNGIFLQFLK